MTTAGIDVDELAARVEVDAKTIRRWVSGATTPYPRHRGRVAHALGCEPHQLWPDLERLIPAAQEDPQEIVTAFARGDDADVPDWRMFLDAAVMQIDLLDFTLREVIQDPAVVARLAAKADAGCQIRVLVSDRDSVQLAIAEAEQHSDRGLTELPALAWDVERSLGYLQPLLGLPGIQVRTFVAGRFNTILRFDEQMLVTLHLWGTPVPSTPLLYLRRQGDAGLFDRFAGHHDAIWHHAASPVAPDPDVYPDPEQHPDRYQPQPTHQHAARPGGLGPN